MRIIPLESPNKIKKAIPFIEKRIKINILVSKKQVTIKGTELNEFLTEKIIRAIDFGFDQEDAILLKNEDFCLNFLNIKNHSKRNNLEEVRARVIGTRGKAKNTIQELTGAILCIKTNEIGIIVDSEHSEPTCQALVCLIQGSKHGNVFSYLEKQNRAIRNFDSDDLGLKEKFKKNLKKSKQSDE